MRDLELEITIAGEALLLLPEKACLHRGSASLLLSDLHYGKEASYQQRGLAMPTSASFEDLQTVDGLWQRHKFERLIILGDMIHDEYSLSPRMEEHLRQWLMAAPFDVVLVAGNHDRHFKKRHRSLAMDVVPQMQLNQLLLIHDIADSPNQACIAGHMHPVFRLRSNFDSQRLPCFFKKNEQLILPSFGSLTGGVTVEKSSHSRVWLVFEGQVKELH